MCGQIEACRSIIPDSNYALGDNMSSQIMRFLLKMTACIL